MDQITDVDLVERVRRGDKEAFGLLVERYQRMVGHIAHKMITDEGIARELAQEAILQAYLSLDHLRDASRFKNGSTVLRSTFAAAICMIRKSIYSHWKASLEGYSTITLLTLAIPSIHKRLQRRVNSIIWC